MSVEIRLREEKDKLIADVILPKYGGSGGKTALDIRVNTEYVKMRLEALGYEVSNGTGPSLRNMRGDTNGTYIFNKKKAPTPAPRVEKKSSAPAQKAPEEKPEPPKVETKKESKPVVVKEEAKPKAKEIKKEPTPLPAQKATKTMKRRSDR
jgi:hypothetical protein